MLCLDAIKLSLCSRGCRALLVQLFLVSGCQTLGFLGDLANAGLQRPNLVVELHSMLWADCTGFLCWPNMLAVQKSDIVVHYGTCSRFCTVEDPVADYTQAWLSMAGCAQIALANVAEGCQVQQQRWLNRTSTDTQLLVLPWLTCCTFLELSAFACLSWSCSCFSKPWVSSTISLSLASLASFLLADSSAFRSQVFAVSLLMRAASSSCSQDGKSAGNG